MKIKTFILTAASLLVLSGNALAGKLEDGIDLFKGEQFEKAIVILEQLATEDPVNPEIHLWLSRCYEKTFQLEKSIKESKIYQELMYKHNDQSKTEPEETNKNEEKQAQPIDSKNDPMKLTRLSDEYVDKIIASRNPADEIRNLKFLDYKTVKKKLAQVPSDSDSLIKLNLKYEIKNRYGLASQEDMLVLYKTRINLLSFEIDSKKFEMSQEKNEDRKKTTEKDILKLVKVHNDIVEVITGLINQPGYRNTDPLSFEYFQSLDTKSDEYIKNLEQKKSEFRKGIDNSTKEIKNYTKLVITQEKELKTKKEQISPQLLEVNVSTLTGPDKESVMTYLTLENKVIENKKKLLNFIAEQEILIDAFNKINVTIQTINPEYIINDAPLPKKEILQEFK